MKKTLLGVLITCAAFAQLNGQTILTAGDLAVAGYNYDDPDHVKIVTLVNLAVGTTFKITDNGWNGSTLTTNEGTYTYTSTSAINAGSIISINTSPTAFSTSGDQILIYQGTTNAPVFIYALSTKPWVTGNINASTSRLPSGLINGTNAIAFATERDNGKYNTVSNSGTKAVLCSTISNSANWANTDSRISTFPAWIFNVSGAVVPEPTSPTNLVFFNLKTWTYDVSFTASTGGVSGYLVLRKQGAASITTPADGITYQQGDFVADAQVAFVGAGVAFNQKGVVANTGYYYSVFAYNGSGATTNYNQAAPLTGNIITPADAINTYYNTMNVNSNSFVTDLKNRIRVPYTEVAYSQFDETNVANFAVRDAPGGQKMIECAYSGQQYAYNVPFAWTPATPFSREHTFCHSWMPTYPSEAGDEYADQHHLFPVNQNSANAVRSNHPLGEVETVTSSFLEGKYGLDINGNTVYEPRESHKGNAARALMYMSLRYDGVNGNAWTFDWLNTTKMPALSEDAQDVALLQAWHIVDEPDNSEITRNDYVQSIQQNRNPFVDHPEYINHIDMNNLNYIAPPGMASTPNDDNSNQYKTKNELIQSILDFDALVYPIPSNGNVNIELNRDIEDSVFIQWVDMQGNVIKEISTSNVGGRSLSIQADEIPDGLYLMHIRTGGNHITVRWMKG